jgi:hypothetical protein
VLLVSDAERALSGYGSATLIDVKQNPVDCALQQDEAGD